MKSLINIINFIFTHPLSRRNKFEALKRFLYYQISKLVNPYPILYSFTDKTKLIVEKEMNGATGNIYCGLHEFEDMSFLLHFLRPEDLFVDVGANIGSYTILASGHIGCKTFAFEPIPFTYKRLLNNLYINQLQEKVNSFNQGIGSERKKVAFTIDMDTMNSVELNGINGRTMDIQIESLNHVLKYENPSLIKVDVEGYEMEVINGASEILSNQHLKAVILELNNAGEKYGFSVNEVHEKMLKYGFLPFHYDPFQRSISSLPSFGNQNTLYLRDVEYVKIRLSHAPSFEVLGQKI
jgi:FkbM family methyltransferase